MNCTDASIIRPTLIWHARNQEGQGFSQWDYRAVLTACKVFIAGFTHLMQNFDETTNYEGNIIELNKKNKYTSRQFFSVLDRGRGCGRGRNGGHNPRGGRGRGQQNAVDGHNGREGRGGRRYTVYNPSQWISSEEWQSMGEDEREMI